MQCPVDGAELVMTERHGVEIDYCPKCRGVWLDRGELDKIIDRATPAVALDEPRREAAGRPDPRAEARPAPRQDRRDHDERRYDDRHHDSRRHDDRRHDDRDDRDGRRSHRRKSFLSEIFDFD